MTNKEFERFFVKVFNDLDKKQKEKGGEYSSEADRFENFNDQADYNQETPLASLRGNWSKHKISIRKMTNDTIKGIKQYPYTLWEEKIYDDIIYSILWLAMLKSNNDKEVI